MAAGRKTGGRRKGTPNKATADVKALAQQYGREAVDTLAEIMRGGDSDKARAAAANALLDRGYGKPVQAVTGEDGGPVQVVIQRFSEDEQ